MIYQQSPKYDYNYTGIGKASVGVKSYRGFYYYDSFIISYFIMQRSNTLSFPSSHKSADFGSASSISGTASSHF